MTTATVTNIHAGADVRPEDYEFVGLISPIMTKTEEGVAEIKKFSALVRLTAPYYSASKCGHCGANVKYRVVLRHAPTGQHIVVGDTCADNFGLSNDEFRSMKLEAAQTRKEGKTAKAWREYKEQNADLDWDYAEEAQEFGSHIIRDLLVKGRHYGSLTEKQFEFLKKLVGEAADLKVRAEENEAKRALAADAPSGVTTVVGTILSKKHVDGFYGSTHKMLVEATEGYKVWITCPTKLEETEVGSKIQFTCELEVSKDDAKFAFGKRPSKVAILEEVK